MVNTSFEISHNWGDPREPDYRNNARVSFAHYKEGDIYLSFSMFPLAPEKVESIVVEVPANIRAMFGNDWARCQIAIQRVVEYLRSQDKLVVHRAYASLVVDTSKVPKWLPVQVKLLKEKHTFLFDTLPTAMAFPFIAVGLATAYYKKGLMGIGFTAAHETLIAIGGLTLGMLLFDIGKRWMFFRNPPLLLALRGWTLADTLSGTFKRYGRRYFVMLCLSLLIISEGLS